MNIARILKKDDVKKYFQDLMRAGLINYSKTGYERWHWQYVENSFICGQDLPVWICILNEKIIGHLGVIPVALKVGSQKIKAGWAVDFMTLPEARGKGVGRFLVDDANKQLDIFFSIGQTDMAFGLFIKMGWKFLGYIPHYIKIWDAKIFVKDKIKNSFIAKVISLPINLLFEFFDYVKRPRISKSIEIHEIENFDEEPDFFWEGISGYYKTVVPRDKIYLSWKYDKQPGMGYVKFRATCHNKTRGYAVARAIKTESGDMEGLIADIIVRPDDKDTTRALIFWASRYLHIKNCVMVRCFVNNKEIESILLDQGFIKRQSSARFVLNKNVEGLNDIYDIDDWFITAGDCDIDR